MPTTRSDSKANSIQNVAAILSIALDEATSFWHFDLLCLNQLVRFRPRGLIYLNSSHDSPEEDDARYYVVDTTLEHRELSERELCCCQYPPAQNDPSQYWVITFQGCGSVITVVCCDFDTETLDLAKHYPHLARG